MLTIADLDNIMLTSKDTLAEWEREFELAFSRPLIVAQMTQEMLTMTEAERELVRQADPELYAAASAQVKRLQGLVSHVPKL